MLLVTGDWSFTDHWDDEDDDNVADEEESAYLVIDDDADVDESEQIDPVDSDDIIRQVVFIAAVNSCCLFHALKKHL